jgi:peptide chain release factor 2
VGEPRTAARDRRDSRCRKAWRSSRGRRTRGCGRSRSGWRSSGGTFDVDAKRKRIAELDAIAADPGLWSDRPRAEALLREKRALEREVACLDETERGLEDATVLLELADQEADADSAHEAAQRVAELSRQIDELELRRLLGGEHDAKNAIVSISAGEGGTDACDWAEILLRTYTRWCERRGFKSEILDLQPGEEAGIKGVTFTVEGEYAYGYLRSEVGIHRLVRISPFDASHRRQTSFAAFTLLPDIGDEVEVDVDEADLRIDTYRAGGAGGQHVNRTDSAVRITHLPSGIVVQCQNERSQHKNKASAMKVLRARLYERAREEREAKLRKIEGEKRKIGFGSQIRSYTLHPQQRVKDHRTNVEVGDAQSVLDGNLEPFMRAWLLQAAGGA